MVSIVIFGDDWLSVSIMKSLREHGIKCKLIAPHSANIEVENDLDVTWIDAQDVNAIHHILDSATFVILVSWPEGTKILYESIKKVGLEGDSVMSVSEVLSQNIYDKIEMINTQNHINTLLDIVKRKTTCAIFIHNNPDPDAIASAVGLKNIFVNYGIDSEIYYGGKIEHQENKALVNALNIELKKIDDPAKIKEILFNDPAIVFVDMAFPGSNNELPADIDVDVIIDHHQLPDDKPEAKYIDVRTDVGATSTIIASYLIALGMDIDETTATALLYGIKTDTRNFTRNIGDLDIKAITYLYKKMLPEIMERLESPPMSIETMDVLGRAIINKEIRGPYLVSSVEIIKERDAIPQASDFLMKLEGVATTLVFGIVGDNIHISARSSDPRVNIGQVLQEAFGQKNAGGHKSSAAAQIPLGIFGSVDKKSVLVKLVENAIKKKFFAVVGAPEAEVDKSLNDKSGVQIVQTE